MATVSPVNPTVYNSSNVSTTDAASSELNKYDFLKLLATELQNQDPLDPLDNKEFIAQLAQFSSLEQMQNMNSSLQSIDDSMQQFMTGQAQSAQSMLISQAAALIGKQVTAEVDGNEIEGLVESVFIEDSVPYALVGGGKLPVSSITGISLAERSFLEEVSSVE